MGHVDSTNFVRRNEYVGFDVLVMCVESLPTFAPSPLRDAWGLVENRPALLRVVAPVALLRAAVTPRA